MMPTISKCVVFSVLLLSVIPGVVGAQVVITEIMYDLKGSDGGREWVEIYNAGTTEVPLTTYKLFENGTAHKITGISGSKSLPAGAYAIIADNAGNFKADWPSYGGLLFDSAFSLSNDGETIVMRNASSTDLDSAQYESSSGAGGDGNSLNRSSAGASFIARTPSPGFAMSSEAIAPPPPKEVVKAAPAQVKSESKKVVEKKVAAPEVAEEEVVEDVDAETAMPLDTSNVAAASVVADVPVNSSVWWLGALVIAAFAASSLLLAKKLSKTEWNIEEMEETG